jgi:hypothetical protein
MLEFTQAALSEHEADQGTITHLQNKIAQAERIYLEKVAAARSNALDPDRVTNTLSTLVQMRLMSVNDSVKVATALKSNPNASLELITKMADMLVTPHEGHELDEKTGIIADDPDGWTAMAEGKTVRVRV